MDEEFGPFDYCSPQCRDNRELSIAKKDMEKWMKKYNLPKFKDQEKKREMKSSERQVNAAKSSAMAPGSAVKITSNPSGQSSPTSHMAGPKTSSGKSALGVWI